MREPWHYMDFGRVDRWETARRQGHQLFATTDIRLSDRAERRRCMEAGEPTVLAPPGP